MNVDVDALVTPSAVVPSTISPDEAVVVVRDVVWQTSSPNNPDMSSQGPIPIGPDLMFGDAATWQQASQALDQGDPLTLGVVFVATDPSYGLILALDTQDGDPQFFGPNTVAPRDTGQFQAFLSWSGNPYQGADPVDLLTAWNVELDASGDSQNVLPGPISLSWEKFLDSAEGTGYPAEGSLEWWSETPPQCRDLSQAPASVAKGFVSARVFLDVPASWRSLPDIDVCIRIAAGTDECSTLGAAGDYQYLPFLEAYAAPGDPIIVQVARLIDGGVSWVDRVTVATIPWTAVAPTLNVLVTLPSQAPPNYASLASDPSPYQAVALTSLPQDEADYILTNMPSAPACATPDCV
ncbi:MAG: hypothetical protein ABR600_02555 [Actinomycetota bacterium]